MHRHLRVHGHTLSSQIRRRGGQRISDLYAPHSKERGIRIGAKGLLVKEIAPAADTLADKQTQGTQVQQIAKVDLAHLAADGGADQGTDNATVNGKPAVPNLHDLCRVGAVIAPLKNHIICPSADDTEDRTPNEHIRHPVQAHTPLVCHTAAVQHRQHKAKGDNDTVKMNIITADGKRHRRQIKVDPQPGEVHAGKITHAAPPLPLQRTGRCTAGSLPAASAPQSSPW